MDFIRYRNQQASLLPSQTGVYALCDLDEVPIYVGQSIDGIRARVRRHLTSARSDVIANRQLDVWEIAFVYAWPVAEKRTIDSSRKRKITPEEQERIGLIERRLYHEYNAQSPLVNGSVVSTLSPSRAKKLAMPKRWRFQIMPQAEIEARRSPVRRLPRQADHFRNLLDHMLNVKNEPELRRALRAHWERLFKYYTAFLDDTDRVDTDTARGETTDSAES